MEGEMGTGVMRCRLEVLWCGQGVRWCGGHILSSRWRIFYFKKYLLNTNFGNGLLSWIQKIQPFCDLHPKVSAPSFLLFFSLFWLFNEFIKA